MNFTSAKKLYIYLNLRRCLEECSPYTQCEREGLGHQIVRRGEQVCVADKGSSQNLPSHKCLGENSKLLTINVQSPYHTNKKEFKKLKKRIREPERVSFEREIGGAREVDQRSGAPVALAGDPCSTPSTCMATYNHVKFQSQGSDAFFRPPRAQGIYMVRRHTCQQDTHTHKIKFVGVEESSRPAL